MIHTVLMLMILTTAGTENGLDVMKSITLSFGDKYYYCQKVMRFSESMVPDFLYFWDMSYMFVHNDMGCVLLCIVLQLELVGEDGTPLEDNARGYLMANGADEEKIQIIIDIYHSCRDKLSVENFQNICTTVMEYAKCLRNGIYNLGWAPDVEDLKKLKAPEFRRMVDGANNIASEDEMVPSACRRSLANSSEGNVTIAEVFDRSGNMG